MMKVFQNRFVFCLITVLMAGLFVFSACTPVNTGTSTPVPTIEPIATMEPVVTIISVDTDVPVGNRDPQIVLDTGSIATSFKTEIVEPVSDIANAPYWGVLPAYTLVTLEGYPVSSHQMEPQIFIYPVKELVEINEGADPIVNSLQTLLQSHQEIENMPFLPLFNAAQEMHVQLQYLDFKNGTGLRYLTQFSQAIVPINNNEFFYTYQGLTGDEKYYVAAVLPVNHPELPLNGQITQDEFNKLAGDFQGYLENLVKTLNPQAANSFTPDLTQLDAMIRSLEIK